MMKKFFSIFQAKEEPMEKKLTTDDFRKELFIFQTKICFEFSNLIDFDLPQNYENVLYKEFQKKPSIYSKETIIIPYSEEEYVDGKVNKFQTELIQLIKESLEKQLEDINSATIETVKGERDAYNFNDYTSFLVYFIKDEYRSKSKHFLNYHQVKNLVELLFDIEKLLLQMDNQEEYILSFFDTIKTLNETTDKLSAFKNFGMICAILNNMKETAENSIQNERLKRECFLTTALESTGVVDQILKLELQYTEEIKQKNQEIQKLLQENIGKIKL